jgi:hypothetical protein
MNKSIIKLMELLKIYNEGKIADGLERALYSFASEHYDINTIDELNDAMAEELTIIAKHHL